MWLAVDWDFLFQILETNCDELHLLNYPFQDKHLLHFLQPQKKKELSTSTLCLKINYNVRTFPNFRKLSFNYETYGISVRCLPISYTFGHIFCDVEILRDCYPPPVINVPSYQWQKC